MNLPRNTKRSSHCANRPLQKFAALEISVFQYRKSKLNFSTASVVDGLVTSQGTLYPLLSRLRRDGWVSTTWADSDAGPPRRYYALTADGARALAGFTEEWERFCSSVDTLLAKGKP